MKIGLLQMDLVFEACNSLKDKRSILQAIKHRLRSSHNVSVAEIGDHDIWRRCQLGAVAIGNEAGSVEKIFRAVLAEIEGRADTVVSDFQIEML